MNQNIVLMIIIIVGLFLCATIPWWVAWVLYFVFEVLPYPENYSVVLKR